MKKKLIIGSTLILSLVGCGGQPMDTTEAQDQPERKEVAEEIQTGKEIVSIEIIKRPEDFKETEGVKEDKENNTTDKEIKEEKETSTTEQSKEDEKVIQDDKVEETKEAPQSQQNEISKDDYISEVGELRDYYIDDSIVLGDLLVAASNDSTLFHDPYWKDSITNYADSIDSTLQELSTLHPPEEIQYIHYELMEFVKDARYMTNNLSTAIENQDVGLMLEMNEKINEANNHLDIATQMIQVQMSQEV